MDAFPKRKRLRLERYDYSCPGAYFVTICTQARRRILSDISVGEGLAPPAVKLSVIGKITEEQILALPSRYPSVHVEKYVIMPNHVHLLFSMTGGAIPGGASPSPTMMDVIRVLKSMTTRMARPWLGDAPLWQRSYHDHVIRNDADYREVWTYIDQNPSKWQEDCFYSE